MAQYGPLAATAGSQGGSLGAGSLANASQLLVAALQEGPSPVTEAPIGPGEAPVSIHYSVTIVITVLVGILFLLVYVQLVMVICFGYKLLTYQTVLLFDILLWASLRLTLYSFYFYHCCEQVDKLDKTVLGWFLVSLPPCLQFFSLAVLVHYFSESIFKVLKRRQEMASLAPPYRKMKKYRVFCEFLWVTSVLTFLAGSLVFHFLIDNATDQVNSHSTRSVLVILRVVLLDGLFLIMGITLGICIIIIYTTRAGKDVLEAQGGRKCIPPLISCLLIILFASRDIYSLVAAISGTNNFNLSGYWVFVTDEGDFGFMADVKRAKYGYIAYLVVLMVWEVLPTYIIISFFRVRLPNHSSLKLRLKPCKVRKKIAHTNQKHFFENPNRYDEHEQLLYPPGPVQRQSSTSTHVSIPSLTGSHQPASHQFSGHNNNNSSGGYGSTNTQPRPPQAKQHYSINSASRYHGNSSHPAQGSVMPGTTPPQLFTSPSFFTDQ